jgi:hypothetical protein
MKDEAEVGKTVTNYDKRPGEAQGFYIYGWFPKRGEKERR